MKMHQVEVDITEELNRKSREALVKCGFESLVRNLKLPHEPSVINPLIDFAIEMFRWGADFGSEITAREIERIQNIYDPIPETKKH